MVDQLRADTVTQSKVSGGQRNKINIKILITVKVDGNTTITL